ncbi:MAG: C10 family peptidase [Paludibacteraceae bacterium]|nr:C10 family peptidase [Paludibacteraceae bacterium]
MEIAKAYYEKVKNDNIDTSVLQVKSELQSRGKYRSAEMISPTGMANMWLVPVDDGWVLVSTNKKTDPILAHFQQVEKPIYEQLPPAAQFMLEHYEEVIVYAKEKCLNCPQNEHWMTLQQDSDNKATASQGTPIVAPLLSVHWKQTGNNSMTPYCDKSYNKFCPNVNAPNQCNKAAVGCVAVAIGQIMWYWRWPYAANVPTTPGGSNTEMHFYEWNLMPDSINNATPMNEVDMVASFLKDCGYMVDMDYGVSSGAYDNDAKEALISFGYNSSTIKKRDKLTTLNWEDKIKAELDAGRPVYYGGMTQFIGGGGHAFVVDGYDSGGLFHVNYGWGSINPNTYYDIDAIPAVNEGEYYTHHECAIMGIKPDANCSSRILNSSSYFSPYFNYAVGGELTVSNATIQNTIHGEISSATQVRLTQGVTISQGSNVHISIREMPCATTRWETDVETESSKRNDAPSLKNEMNEKNNSKLYISPNPVSNVLLIHSIEALTRVCIYNLNGQCLLQTKETEIDVSALPAGLYILIAQTATDDTLQSKFVKR